LLKVGLTGGIASGKSTVSKMFADLGVHVIQADTIAHQLMQPGERVYDEVVRHFGDGILNPDGTINRSRLAELVFSSNPSSCKPGSFNPDEPARVQELNQIVHPAVIQTQEAWMEDVGRRDRQAIAMVEAALLLEAGAGKRFDRLVVVTCRPEQRTERWARKQNVDRETARQEVSRRMAAQLPDKEKIQAADHVIDNSGSLQETADQVRVVYEQLRCEAVEKILP
jgi:dephospho-CoA kinase